VRNPHFFYKLKRPWLYSDKRGLANSNSDFSSGEFWSGNKSFPEDTSLSRLREVRKLFLFTTVRKRFLGNLTAQRCPAGSVCRGSFNFQSVIILTSKTLM
jgi:hypothetical protein